MFRFLLAAVLALTLSANAFAQAAAPRPQTREGFGISFGFGGGSAGSECDVCTSDRTTALSGYLRLGGHVSPTVFVGFESNGWANSEEGIDESLGFYSAVVQWYPNAEQGFYLKGGLGISAYTATDGFDEISGSALGLSVGTGYDIRVGKNFSLTPFANFLMSSKGELDFNDEATGFKISANLIQFGLGFTWH
jgi:opacity protein-like surface antigen